MSGRHIRVREEAQARYPRLAQFVAANFHQDWAVFHATAEEAIDDAIAGPAAEALQEIRRELVALLAGTEDDTRLRTVLNVGLGLNLGFARAADARTFAQDLERRLLDGIRAVHSDARRSRGAR